MDDILIHGMEMPATCFECPFMYSRRYCSANHKLEFSDEKYSELKERHPDCPLHELPPHGDLIDVSKIVLEYGGLAKISPHDFVGIAKYFAKQIEGQPAVVPAERRGR